MESKRICVGILLVATFILSACMSESGTVSYTHLTLPTNREV